MTKTVAVFFDRPGRDEAPLDESDYIVAYGEFAHALRKRDADLYMVRSQETYKGDNVFSGGWKFADGNLERVNGEIDADVIFNKGGLKWERDANVINVTEVEELCTNKSKTYAMFPQFSMQTFVVHNGDELRKACDAIHGKFIVAKPLNKEGGSGVFIADKEEILRSIAEFPYIVQEFIDTNAGIPGLMSGIHDFRIASVNGSITHCYYRTPPPGKLLANVAQGGEMHFLQEKDIPDDAMKVFREVEEYMKRFPRRVYSVDMGRHSDGSWKIIELNSKPGLLPRKYDDGMKRFQEHVADLLIEAAENVR